MRSCRSITETAAGLGKMRETGSNHRAIEYRKLYEEGRRALEKVGIPDAALDARLLLEEVCGTNLQTLLVYPEEEVSEDNAARYRSWIERRCSREPTAMILGKWDFMGLTFRLNRSTLIPEQDTECLVEAALNWAGKRQDRMLKILDLCTGSGCILLSLLHAIPEAEGLGTDISGEALKAARQNCENLELTKKARFLQGDLWKPVEEEKFDLIVSNPPYVPTGVIPTLELEVRTGEPYAALDGGEDGLVFYRKILREARRHLCPEGTIIMESGFDEADAIAALMKEAGFAGIEIFKDYGGLDRVVQGSAEQL